MTRKIEKTVSEYKVSIVEKFSSANKPEGYKEANKNQAMFELLNSGKIVPISPSLWMATKSAREEFLGI